MDVVVTAVDGIGVVEPVFPVSVLRLLCEELDAVGGAWQCVDLRTGECELLLHGPPHVLASTVRRVSRSLHRTDPRLVALARGELAPVTGEQSAGSRSAWQRSPCRRFLSTFMESPQTVTVGLRGGGAEVRSLAFARSGADFTPAALSFLTEVQPVLQAVDRCVARLGRWADASRAAAAEVAARVGLTCREVEVLGLVAQGLTAAAVSRRLGCSTRTVHRHVGHLFQKLQVHDRLGAVLEAQRLGLLPGPQPPRRPRATGAAGRTVEPVPALPSPGAAAGGGSTAPPQLLGTCAGGHAPRARSAWSPA